MGIPHHDWRQRRVVGCWLTVSLALFVADMVWLGRAARAGTDDDVAAFVGLQDERYRAALPKRIRFKEQTDTGAGHYSESTVTHWDDEGYWDTTKYMDVGGKRQLMQRDWVQRSRGSWRWGSLRAGASAWEATASKERPSVGSSFAIDQLWRRPGLDGSLQETVAKRPVVESTDSSDQRRTLRLASDVYGAERLRRREAPIGKWIGIEIVLRADRDWRPERFSLVDTPEPLELARASLPGVAVGRPISQFVGVATVASSELLFADWQKVAGAWVPRSVEKRLHFAVGEVPKGVESERVIWTKIVGEIEELSVPPEEFDFESIVPPGFGPMGILSDQIHGRMVVVDLRPVEERERAEAANLEKLIQSAPPKLDMPAGSGGASTRAWMAVALGVVAAAAIGWLFRRNLQRKRAMAAGQSTAEGGNDPPAM